MHDAFNDFRGSVAFWVIDSKKKKCVMWCEEEGGKKTVSQQSTLDLAQLYNSAFGPQTAPSSPQ